MRNEISACAWNPFSRRTIPILRSLSWRTAPQTGRRRFLRPGYCVRRQAVGASSFTPDPPWRRPTKRLGRQASCLVPGLCRGTRRVAVLCGCGYVSFAKYSLSLLRKSRRNKRRHVHHHDFSDPWLVLGEGGDAYCDDGALGWVLPAQSQ